MKTRFLLPMFLSCSGCTNSVPVVINQRYIIKKEVIEGRTSRILYLYFNGRSAKIISENLPGVILATRDCSYNRKNEGRLNFGHLSSVEQSGPRSFVFYDRYVNAYYMKFRLGYDFDKWRSDGKFCAYYHASRAYGSPEVFSNMLQF